MTTARVARGEAGHRAPAATRASPSTALVSVPSLRRTRLLDEVAHALRELIVTSELSPGTQLRQSDLAERLGVSRTPLREALRILEADGLVVVSNKSRTVEVVSVNPQQLVEMYELREAIDGLAARLAATTGLSPDAEAKAVALRDAMRGASDPYDPASRTDAHARFHSLFAEHSGNAYVASMASIIRVSGAWLYHPFATESSATSAVVDGTKHTLAESMAISDAFHAEILGAVLERDPDRAERVARSHISNTLKALRSIVAWAAGGSHPASP